MPLQTEIAAIHEAGHAVTARVLGQEVTLVSLSHVTTRHPRGNPLARRNEAIVALAGPVAEMRLCNYTEVQCAELWETDWRTDVANALRNIDADSDLLASIQHVAECIVGERWSAIERVAAALIEHGELTGTEIDAMLGSACAGPATS